MTKPKEKPILNVGDTFKTSHEKFEVIHVSAQTNDAGDPHHFVYEIQLQSEADEKREIEAKLAADEAAKATAAHSEDEPAQS